MYQSLETRTETESEVPEQTNLKYYKRLANRSSCIQNFNGGKYGKIRDFRNQKDTRT